MAINRYELAAEHRPEHTGHRTDTGSAHSVRADILERAHREAHLNSKTYKGLNVSDYCALLVLRNHE